MGGLGSWTWEHVGFLRGGAVRLELRMMNHDAV